MQLFSVHSQGCKYHHYLILELFITQKRKTLDVSSQSPFPTPSAPSPSMPNNLLLPPAKLLSVPVNLPVLDIFCKWNHVISGLV